MADTSPARVARLSALRDAMMAANLRAIAEHGPALVFSHNLHLQRNKSTMPLGDQELEWWSAGAIVATHLGDRYAFLASALGTVGDDAPPPDTLEGVARHAPVGPRARRRPRPRRGASRRPPRAPRRDYAYFPLDPAHLDTIDGVLFLSRVRVPDWPRQG